MTDLKDPRLIYLKGLLFLLAGLMSAGLLLVYAPSVQVALLLGITIWSSCRFYYFAFYVIERYVDGNYRYAGLTSALAHLIRQRMGFRRPNEPD